MRSHLRPLNRLVTPSRLFSSFELQPRQKEFLLELGERNLAVPSTFHADEIKEALQLVGELGRHQMGASIESLTLMRVLMSFDKFIVPHVKLENQNLGLVTFGAAFKDQKGRALPVFTDEATFDAMGENMKIPDHEFLKIPMTGAEVYELANQMVKEDIPGVNFIAWNLGREGQLLLDGTGLEFLKQSTLAASLRRTLQLPETEDQLNAAIGEVIEADHQLFLARDKETNSLLGFQNQAAFYTSRDILMKATEQQSNGEEIVVHVASAKDLAKDIRASNSTAGGFLCFDFLQDGRIGGVTIDKSRLEAIESQQASKKD